MATLLDSDLVERPEKADDNDDDDDHKSSTTTAKEKPKYTAKSKPGKTTEVNAEAVPVPAPDSGTTITAIHPGILPVIPSQAPTTLTVPASSWYLDLTSTAVIASSTVLSGASVPAGAPTGASRALSNDKANQVRRQESKHLPAALIVLVSVGLSFLILGAFIVWRARRRPRKRSCPTPSLPILQDPFTDQDFKVDEESLFGGQERGSAVARPNSNGLWTWTQYTPRPSAQVLGNKSTMSDTIVTDPPKVAQTLPFHEKTMPPPAPPPVHVALPDDRARENPPLQQMQSALTRATNRVSTLSMSIYPTSPQSNSGIGLALGGMSPLTADGTPVLQRKPSANRLSKSQRSMRHSLAATEYLDMQADIYGGAQFASHYPSTSPRPPPSTAMPSKPALRKSTSIGQGRARVKAPYNPGAGAVLRSSSTVAGITTLARGNRSSVMAPSEETQYILPPLSPALKSDARRERDTRALTTAMGLTTPDVNDLSPLSPQPTLYPDDSITLAGERQRSRTEEQEKGSMRTGGHDRVQSEAMSPGMEASARLGNLMLAEFTSMASLPSTRTVANAGGTNAAGGITASGSKSRVVRKNVRPDDKPPRVPSPPPLPSLAQMAMAHANPEEYADYRSPTYSIYGLYEAERKSRLQSEAGF
ncbi:hypothetical protein BD414DRAFT_519757 [Trametes punicea]|nr:hypothetical protein BD414DRAFT_519757 [Trametes punicea]